MILLGLTGSIGMGKSTVSLVLTAMGVPVLDSDAVVHRLYASGGAAVCPVADAFGSGVVTPEGSISRPALSALVLGDDGAMARLEAIVHPLVDAARWEFLARAEAASQPLVVLDVPLLYEKGYERTVDAVVVVSTGDAAMQRRRVLARPGMTAEKFDAIVARQVPDKDKRTRADFVVETGCTAEETEAAVKALVNRIRAHGDGGSEGGVVEAKVYDRMKGELSQQ
mmetsp:Transcript_7316/g.11504  ORF Transcript_7316/g.11504 Transcript_7316/m.11504 type:complete len:225 (-) Transcript_7316:2170-2844(-)